VFRYAYSPRDEVAALVRHARDAGLSRFIVLHPDHGYGRTLERLFDQEVSTSGGVACEAVPYPPGTKSFVDYVRIAMETTCDTILLADVADQVALIAPTFAAEGAWSVAGGPLPETAEREIHFLLPSPSWSPELLRRAGRYLRGARIALPFYAESGEPAVERFRTAYETRYGRTPGPFSAYGYDAYRLISAAIRQGAQTRAALSGALSAEPGIDTVTSMRGFGPERAPLSEPAIYRIFGDSLELEQ
jgi:ABC-type branched-subunit amino acid transport system substrate-binding protein